MKVWLLRGAFLAFGLTVLFLSFTRASLEILAKDLGEDKIKGTMVEFTVKNEDGTTIPGNYNLPEVSTLPSNPLYGFKRLRDILWLYFAADKEKPRVAMLIADKKITEAWQLYDPNGNLTNNNLAIDASNEALDKLEYADGLVSRYYTDDDATRQIKKQIFMASQALNSVTLKAKNGFSIDTAKYNQLLDRINKWNEKQAEERWNWEK